MTSAAETHRDVFGSAPQGVWSAPGRVNLIGEHTDYNGGLALPIALPQRTTAACSPRPDDLLRVHSAHEGETVEVPLGEVGPGSPEGWPAYVAGVLWALREAGGAVRGLDVTVTSEVPLGAGLSSSAALECAVGAAASDLFDLGLLADAASRGRLADACVRAENEVAGAATGGMDQSAALLCQEGAALLLDCRDGATEQVPFDLEAAGMVLLVTDTRAAHSLSDGQYEQRRRACERAAHELGVQTLREVAPGGLEEALARLSGDELRRRTRHVVTEIARVEAAVGALRAGDLEEVGRLFTASHASLRDDYEVSCAELDVSVEAVEAAGALGARMTGGGFGGSSIALLPAGSAEAAVDAVGAAFAARGWAEPACFRVTAGGAAGRDA
ncbi:galactokinase [Phycicoccus endophyticus]|uniref:Galactokinase n=1 Tax=Phycicoccus endophyticus TaxID=1690220 RepID=A0A7G9R2V3_9MICO|nr:galactokinase [Phycicoccus endophyticus]NHI20400.1 galactokinase [Phycicoccus endophyticus]QNN49928.1 galactokinase [Phycicoccus endophyticus]GGL29527.1 galactokinase [Phycicoccus endophyticus]